MNFNDNDREFIIKIIKELYFQTTNLKELSTINHILKMFGEAPMSDINIK